MATDALGENLAATNNAPPQRAAADQPLAAPPHHRWPVKTGADPAAAKLVGQSPTATTIAHLVSLPVPAVLPEEARTAGTEETVWQVQATLIGYKQELDADYHLVIKDGNGNTMVAEIPNPADLTPGGFFTQQIAAARNAFDGRFGALRLEALAPGVEPKLTAVTESVTIIGLGFFDYKHGQDGCAPNAIELHPVISVEFQGPAQAPAGA